MPDPALQAQLAEERFGPAGLDEDQVQLLAAVAQRRVRRHRTDPGSRLSAGHDIEHLGAGAERPIAGRRLRVLARRSLVVLDIPVELDQPREGAPNSWPWKLTCQGDVALARAAPRSRTSPAGPRAVPAGATRTDDPARGGAC